MGKIFYLFICVALLSACNNEKASEIPAVITVEQELKNDVNQFPDSLLLVETLVQYYRENGNYDNAIFEVNNAIKKDSSNARFWKMKAILHSENGDTIPAIRSFEKTIYLLPEPADIISLGTLYAETKNPAALEMADALIVGNKAKAEKEALFIKGLYYAGINQKEKAISFFDECIKLNYTFMYAYREKCLALYDLGRYEDALEVIEKSLILQNRYEEGYYYKGMCLEKLNRIREAIESYQTAIAYAPDYVEAKDALARLGMKS